MKTLVLGNGFDIDHELPTKYKDFLCFVEVIKEIQILEEKGDSSSYILDTELKKYVYNLLYLDNKKKTFLSPASVPVVNIVTVSTMATATALNFFIILFITLFS